MTTATFLIQLQNLTVDRIDMDEAVAASALSKMIVNEYKRLDIDPPDWLKTRNDELEHQVQMHLRDFILRSARQAALEVDGLKTREERRSEALRNKEKWEAKLQKLNSSGTV